MTTALKFNSNYMAEDKATNKKKTFAILIAVAIAVLVGLVLVVVEVWVHHAQHKPKIN